MKRLFSLILLFACLVGCSQPAFVTHTKTYTQQGLTVTLSAPDTYTLTDNDEDMILLLQTKDQIKKGGFTLQLTISDCTEKDWQNYRQMQTAASLGENMLIFSSLEKDAETYDAARYLADTNQLIYVTARQEVIEDTLKTILQSVTLTPIQ